MSLELESKNGRDYYKEEILCSIAISLKRIADSLEKSKISGGDIVMPDLTPEKLKELEEHWAKQGGYEVK